MLSIRHLLLFSFTLITGSALAQQPDVSVGVRAHHGSFLTSLTRSIYIKDSYTQLVEANYSRQTDGSKDWHRANGLPRTGFAALFGNSGSRRHIGNIGGAIAFAEWNVLRRKSFTSSFRAGGGVGLVEKPYDPETNHKNLLLGTRVNCLLHFTWRNELRILPRVYLDAGLSFTHLSNGRSQLPNLGLNVPALTTGVRYVLPKTPPPEAAMNNPERPKCWTVLTGTSLGIKQSPTVGSKRYLVNLVNVEAARKFAPFAAYAGGVQLSYDRSTGSRYPDDLLPYGETIKKEFNAALYASYEQLLGKLSIPVQLGVYLLEAAYGERLYQSFGVRYRVRPNWIASVQLKTHAGHADFIHYGIAYQLP